MAEPEKTEVAATSPDAEGTQRSSVEIKKSPLAEHIKSEGYELTEEERDVSNEVSNLERELERALLADSALKSPKKPSAPEIHFQLHTEDGPSRTTRFLHVHDPPSAGHSDHSDIEHSDYDEDYEPHPEAYRKMSVTERAQLERMMRDADYHHESTDDAELLNEWAFWIDKNVKKGVSEESFLESLHKLGSFKTSHKFSELLLTYSDELINIHQHSEKCNIRLFREGVTPTREDPKNTLGGQYVVFLPKDRTEVKRLWLEFMISAIGERFHLKGEVTGIVLGLKRRADTIAIWTDRGCHPSHYAQQKEHICEVLGMAPETKIKYNNHHANPNKKPSMMRGKSWSGSNQHSPLSSPILPRANLQHGVSMYNGPASPSTQRKAADLADEWRRSPAKAMDANAWETVRHSPQPQRRSIPNDESYRSPQTHRRSIPESQQQDNRSPRTARRSNPDTFDFSSGLSPRNPRRSNPDKYDDFAGAYGSRSPNMGQNRPSRGVQQLQTQGNNGSRSPSLGPNDRNDRGRYGARQMSQPAPSDYAKSPARGQADLRPPQSPARKTDGNR